LFYQNLRLITVLQDPERGVEGVKTRKMWMGTGIGALGAKIDGKKEKWECLMSHMRTVKEGTC
jgi:hypothetical protein